MQDMFSVKVIFGSVEPKVFYKFEGGKMVAYSFAIHRDSDGMETHRTPPEALSSIGYSDGSPFTEDDYSAIIIGEPKKKVGFFSRFFSA
ncbi:hypothetical protein [Sulfurovum sp.]|uniref:hypothetical protein n=1 Tax=Sulfurovum sp. TaxID=1969726 RepID=UPI0035696FD4